MSDTSVSSKWWVVQLALEHRICILSRTLAWNFAILDLDVVMLDFFLVTIFKIGCVTLVGEQILCFSLCLQSQRIILSHLVMYTSWSRFAPLMLPIIIWYIGHLLTVFLGQKVLWRVLANNNIFLSSLKVYIWRIFAILNIRWFLTGVIALLIVEVDSSYLV